MVRLGRRQASMAASARVMVAEWDPSTDDERRSGVQRRRDAAVPLAEPCRFDDRRFGRGRRWEDWCRPVQIYAAERQGAHNARN